MIWSVSSSMPEPLIIAIDGPAASGKSTIGRRVAQALGLLYVDSGAVYRGVTWAALRRGVDTSVPGAVADLVTALPIEFLEEEGSVRFQIDGVDPGDAIRSDDVNHHVSPVAAVPEVRRAVVSWLRGMTQLGGLVMEGRDIGSVVFADTPFKFYLDASAEERARRRHVEQGGEASEAGIAAMNASLKRRDTIDSTRKADPLKVAEGAIIVNSTGMGIDDVVDFVLQTVRNGA